MRYVTSRGEVATTYPANPNGSPAGLSSVCNSDGRVTILMPHPERTIAGTSGSWWPQVFAVTGGIGKTPWFQMFVNEGMFAGGHDSPAHSSGSAGSIRSFGGAPSQN